MSTDKPKPKFRAGEKVHVTLLIPETLDKNIEAYALMKDRSKTDIIIEALREFLHKNGIRSDKVAKIVLSY